jgi:hypothetical protein
MRESSGISQSGLTAQQSQTSPAAETSTSRRKTASLILATAVCTLLVAAVLVYFFRPQPAPAERLEFSVPLQNEMSHLALSTDGHMLAFVSPDPVSTANMVSVQRIGSPGVSVLPGTAGASYPFWSPDDAYVAFFADGKLKKSRFPAELRKSWPPPLAAGVAPGDAAAPSSSRPRPPAGYRK